MPGTDILIIHQPPAGGLWQQTLDPQAFGQTCTGIMKLVQRWLVEFGTEVGSRLYAKSRGCGFFTELRAGRLRTETDIWMAFSASALIVGINLSNDETTQDPLDERYGGTTLTGLIVAPIGITMQIKIASKANVVTTITIPVQLGGPR